jgi:hypothetical protein
MSKGKKLEE